MKKKAIITGATGFVGSNLCRKLLDGGWEVSIISRSTSNYQNIEDIKDKIHVFENNGSIFDLMDFFKKRKAKVVFHLASFFVEEHMVEDMDTLVDSNIRFGLHVLEAMKESNTKLIINTGSSWQHYHSDEYNPANLYAATKEAFEDLMKYYVEAENVRAITLKLFDTYGENDRRPKLINLLHQFSEN